MDNAVEGQSPDEKYPNFYLHIMPTWSSKDHVFKPQLHDSGDSLLYHTDYLSVRLAKHVVAVHHMRKEQHIWVCIKTYVYKQAYRFWTGSWICT